MSEPNGESVEQRRVLAAKNQSLFREVNERVVDLSASASFVGFVCECLDNECAQVISLSLEEYEHVRSSPQRFFVTPGHEVAEVEVVVEATERFVIVEKIGAAAEVAKKLNPRARPRRN